MKKSPHVLVTLVASVGLAARAQQSPDPCDAASFNEKVCKSSVRRGGYCAQGAWVPLTYQQSYPYYYDLYQQFLLAGGVVNPVDGGNCPHGIFSHGVFVSHGGFGSTGAAHHAGC